MGRTSTAQSEKKLIKLPVKCHITSLGYQIIQTYFQWNKRLTTTYCATTIYMV